MKKSTRFAHIGRPKIGVGTSVNHSITHASTLLFDKAEDLYNLSNRTYGRHGSELHDGLIDAFCALEDGAGCTLTSCGLAANTLSIQSVVKSGDHILVTDSAYGGTRFFSDVYLSKMGVEAEYYDPRIGADIGKLIKPNTSCIALESPGSLTLEIQDLPAISKVAKKHNIKTIVDNTWSAGLVYSPLALGADIVTHSASKYYSGHADVMLGAVISKDKAMAEKVRLTNVALGNTTAPDPVYQILRGFRTVVTRFNQQADTALRLANWLESRDEVSKVIHPALESHPDHDLWNRDFTGSACLFSFELKPCAQDQVHGFLDQLKFFGKGFSFGGFESVIIHCDPQLRRNHPQLKDGLLIRIGCGLEDFEDLKSDLTAALENIQFDDKGA